jgi:hypothetical protein
MVEGCLVKEFFTFYSFFFFLVPAKSLCRLYIICTAQYSFHCYRATLYMKVYLGLVPVFTYSRYLLKDAVVYVLFVVNYSGCMCEV